MQIIISPAKTLDFTTTPPVDTNDNIRFSREATILANELKQLNTNELSSLMNISPQLARLNHHRYQLWNYPFDNKNNKACLFAFKGDVYTGLDAYSLSPKEIEFANSKLRILSGMYGLLRPLDSIMPYRLEMGTKLSIGQHKNLYDFWGNSITDLLKKDMDDNQYDTLINLASNEYFKTINKKRLDKRIISPAFKNLSNGKYKVISFYAKKARGLMTRFIIQNNISDPEELIAFNEDGYYYNGSLSTENQPVFVRDNEQ